MLYILFGKCAAGKDTLQEYLIKKGYEPLRSMTSRPMRDGEVNGREYFFVTKEEFRKKIEDGKMLEYRTYDTLVNGNPDTWYYGLPVYELEDSKDYVTIVDTYGAEEVLKYYGREECIGVFVDADRDTREKRAMSRGSFDKTEWDRRASDDDVRFSDEKVDKLARIQLRNNGTLETLYEMADKWPSLFS